MANKINIVVSADGKSARHEFDMTGKSVDGLTESTDKSTKSSKAMGMAAAAAKVAIVATGVAAVAAAKYAVTSAADYEQSLNIFASVSGATAEQMKLVAAQSRALGKDISLPGVSAADAALAMTELAKAGLSVNDSMAASKGVLSLAKAGQMDTAQAAEIAGNALMAFGLKGEEANRVADLLAAAANASSAGVHDLGISLSQASAVAAMTKRPVEDVVTQLSLMANAGLKGSDAGTSVKSMLMALISPSSTASGAMKEIGFNAYTAGGQLKSTREIIQDMTKALNGKTDAQKNSLMADIFGSDGIRAASIVMKDGVAGYDKMRQAVTKQGASADLAAAQNAGFKGALDALQSSLETVAIDVGMKMLPALTGFVNFLSEGVEPAFHGLMSGLADFSRIVASVVGPSMSALAGVVQTQLWPALNRLWKEVIVPLVPVLGGVLVAAIYVLVGAANVLAWALAAVVNAGVSIVSFFTQTLPSALVVAFSFIGEKATWLKDHFAESVGLIVGFFATLPFKLPLYVFQAIGSIVAWVASIKWGQVFGAIGSGFGAIWESVKNTAVGAFDFIRNIKWGDVLASLGKGVSNSILGLIEGALNGALSGLPGSPSVKFPRFASGTGYAPGGTALVGEHGPELVDLPRGAQVTQAYRTRNQLSSGGGAQTSPAGHSVYIKEVHNHNDVDVDRMIRSIGFKLATA